MDWYTGKYFIETIKQGAFHRAIERTDKIDLMLDHEKVIGDTNSNLGLKEDEIGLRAKAVITDAEVVALAKEKRLRGWSFGFTNPTETVTEGEEMNFREVSDLDLLEVSIIDDRMKPAYNATSIEARAEGKRQNNMNAVDFEYVLEDEPEPPEPKPDHTNLRNLIDSLKR